MFGEKCRSLKHQPSTKVVRAKTGVTTLGQTPRNDVSLLDTVDRYKINRYMNLRTGN